MSADWVEIGRVVSVHPARRELRIRPVEHCRAAFGELTWLHVQRESGTPLRCRVAETRPADSLVCVICSPGVLRETVAELRGSVVVLPGADAVRFLPDRPPASELIGMAVREVCGREVGRIAGAFSTPAHEVLEVEHDPGGTLLLPYVDAVVADVDVSKGVVIVNDIEPFAASDAD